ncbi:hypothetical protein [Williamsia sp.]|uniref:hypothetical protein n=1 Tax=Williamsia sp. TaxID=1872085 RepID=UPI001A2B3967|nr:hypothetical protein [Williamsia sp.]MBJ7290005.1 hypothetical protein [Williamsia sp.]
MTHEQHTFWGTESALIRTDSAANAVRREFRRLQRGVYVDPTAAVDATHLIRAAALRAGPGAVVAGVSAAILHGVTYVDHDPDIELIRDLNGQGRRFDSVRITRTDQLDPADVTMIDGLAVTNPVRTAYDLGRRTPDWRALGRLDDLARHTDLDLRQLWAYTRDHPRTKGIRQLRELSALVDPKAESPGESWLRLLMIRHGLPRPESQIIITDHNGREIARFDLGYRRYKIGIDYDGVDFHTSPTDRAHDMRRDMRTRDLGWEPLRVTGERMSADPHGVTDRIAEELAIRGFESSTRAARPA